MALDATVGGSSANSYATRANADSYFGDRLDVTEWDAASNDIIYQDSDEIPRQISEATYELALAIVKDNTLLADTGLEGFQNVKLGALDVTPRFREGGTIPANVDRLLRGLKTSSGYTARLLKS